MTAISAPHVKISIGLWPFTGYPSRIKRALININVVPNKAPLLTIERRGFCGFSSSMAKTPLLQATQPRHPIAIHSLDRIGHYLRLSGGCILDNTLKPPVHQRIE